MSESLNRSPTPVAQADAVLPETLRAQYLSAMGIQTWYDPSNMAAQSDSTEAQIETALTDTPADHSQNANVAEQTEVATSVEPVQSAAVDPLAVTVDSLETPADLSALNAQMQQCQLCELHATRKQVVCGEGADTAKLMIISDAPVNDAAENALYEAADKQMLLAMLQAIGLDLSSVYLTSLVKCRPPEQRAPHTSEMICCDDHLSQQIKLIQPAAIMILGEQASRQLLLSQKSLMDLRLRHHQHLDVPVFASYHPGDLYHSAETKRKVWQDLLQIKHQLSKP